MLGDAKETVMKALALVLALLVVGALPARADPEANKKAVLEFYDKALNQKDFDAASKYLGSRYIQHNPGAPDGIEGLKGFIALRKEKFPSAKSEIKRAFAEGDYVILHVHGVREPGDRGVAHRRHLPAGERQDRRALGRRAADPGEDGEQQRDVLTSPMTSQRSKGAMTSSGVSRPVGRAFELDQLGPLLGQSGGIVFLQEGDQLLANLAA